MNPEPSSWGEFLLTPPNMFEQNQCEVPKNILSQLQPPSQFNQLEINEQFLTIPNTSQLNTQFIEFNEIESRTLKITNVNINSLEEEIFVLFNNKYSINKIYMNQINEGIVFIEFFDLRHATAAKLLFNGYNFNNQIINISYGPLQISTDLKKPNNNGTIVIFHLPNNISNEELNTFFNRFGEIREIRSTPNKNSQKFIEYWDIRAAEKALLTMNYQFFQGSRLSIEFSHPGGFRKNNNNNNIKIEIQPPKIQKIINN